MEGVISVISPLLVLATIGTGLLLFFVALIFVRRIVDKTAGAEQDTSSTGRFFSAMMQPQKLKALAAVFVASIVATKAIDEYHRYEKRQEVKAEQQAVLQRWEEQEKLLAEAKAAGFSTTKEHAAHRALLEGDKLAEGKGVAKDLNKAAEWYSIGAQSGNAEAQFKYGNSLEKGEGVPRDIAVAAQWYEESAQNGNPEAQYTIGLMYYKGNGVEKDRVAGATWIKKAADQGHVQAQSAIVSIRNEMRQEMSQNASAQADDAASVLEALRLQLRRNLASGNPMCVELSGSAARDYSEALDLYRSGFKDQALMLANGIRGNLNNVGCN